MTSAVAPRPPSASQPALRRPLSIFVPHASDHLTDRRAHGDGLIAYEVASRLARRGHTVYAASPTVSVSGPVPPTLHLRELAMTDDLRARLAYMRRMRGFFAEANRRTPIDLIHQLNPVYTGMSLALADKKLPIVLGSYVGDWPAAIETDAVLGRLNFPAASIVRSATANLQQRRASALLLSTPAAISRIVDRERDGGKVHVVPHGIDPAVWREAAEAGMPDGPPTIVFVGGLEKRKGVLVLLDAFDDVARAVPDVRLLIAGEGWAGQLAIDRVARSPYAAQVSMLGRVDRRDLPALMRSAHVACVPSLGEPFGMTILEAMASARPVVTTDVGGPADMVDDDGGVRVPCGDAPALARALVDVLRSDRKLAMGRHNREVVERRFAWDAVIDRLESLYATLLVPTS